MASGFDARVALSTAEVTYGTRVAPTRFQPLTAEDLVFTVNRYTSPAIGTGAWGRPSIVTTKVGAGSLSGDVPTTGFGFVLNYLNTGTNTPVQDGATTSYATTFSLASIGGKSFTTQVQNPPVSSSTLVPHDMTGCMAGGITFSWSAGGVLSYNMPIIYQNLDTAQSLVSYVAPTAYDLFSFTGGSITIGGVLETNIIGDGSIEIGFPLRDDAFTLGSGGLIAKPVLADKPTVSGSFTADFNDNTNLTRTLNNTSADVVMKFEGATIASTFKYTLQVTLPDCVFTTGRATVSGPGPMQQTVNFQAASSTADAPEILYRSTGSTL
jgi:hypothetical protein